MITKKLFGKYEGKDVYCYTLDNEKGLSAEILSFGGIIKNLYFKGADVVLGRDTLEEYSDNDGYFGAIIGRNSNRIHNAEFVLDGKKYTLAKNDGNNNLHGGMNGFDKKVWSVSEKDGEEPQIVLSTLSEDGEEGFPGRAEIFVTYTLTKENSIKIEYHAVCDKTTVMNLTNHAYFNLNGHSSGTVDNHKISIESDFFTPNTDECMPYGEILSVENTPFDLRQPKVLKEGFDADFEQIRMFGGYDHNFVLNGTGFRKVAEVEGDKTGIKMEVLTDCVGIQLYTGNCIDTERVCKNGEKYAVHQALCLETQFFPNSLELSFFPSPVLKKGEEYNTVTEYKFK